MCTLLKWESAPWKFRVPKETGKYNCDKRDRAESDHPHSQMAWFSEVNSKDPKFWPWVRTIPCNPFRTLVGPSKDYVSTLYWQQKTVCLGEGGLVAILHLFYIWFINWIWSLFLFLSKGKLCTFQSMFLSLIFLTFLDYHGFLSVSYYIQPVSQLLMSEVYFPQQTMNSLILRSGL